MENYVKKFGSTLAISLLAVGLADPGAIADIATLHDRGPRHAFGQADGGLQRTQ
jgi:hypothetical protein